LIIFEYSLTMRNNYIQLLFCIDLLFCWANMFYLFKNLFGCKKRRL